MTFLLRKMHLFFDLIAKGAICDIQLIRLLEKLILLRAELEQKVTSQRPLSVFLLLCY